MNRLKSPIKFLPNGIVLITVDNSIVISNWNKRYIGILNDLLKETHIFVNNYSYSEVVFDMDTEKKDELDIATELFIDIVNSNSLVESLDLTNSNSNLIDMSMILDPSKIKEIQINSKTKYTDTFWNIFSSVTSLKLSDPDFVDVNKMISNLKDLESLTLTGSVNNSNIINDIITSYPRLTSLSLETANSKILDMLGRLPELEKLTLDSFDIENFPPCLYELPNLKELDITRTHISMDTFELAKIITNEFPHIQSVKFPPLNCGH